MERSCKTLLQIFTKIIHCRRLTGSWISLWPLFLKNFLNLFAPLKQIPVGTLYPQLLWSFTKTLRQLTDLGNFESFIRWSALKINFVVLFKLHSSTPLWMFSWYVSKQLPRKHRVEIMLVQRCFCVELRLQFIYLSANTGLSMNTVYPM